MSRILNPLWNISLQNTSLDKRTNRTAISPGYCHMLAGVDGRLSGGLRPFPGFKLTRRLATSANNDYVTTGGNSAPVANDKPLNVYWIEPFSIRVGSADYATGWVVRGRDQTTANYLFVEFRYNGQWYFKKITNGDLEGVGPTWAVASSTTPIQAVSSGRILYIMQKGQPTISLYVESPSPATIHVGHTGPQSEDEFPLVIEDHSTTALGSGTAIRIVDLGSKALTSYGRVPIFNSGGGNAGFAEENVKTHAQATEVTVAKRSGELAQVSKGDYVFAYQMYNKFTGARSALSQRVVRRVEDYGSDSVRLFALEIPSSELTGLQDNWTHIYVYRSVSALDSGGSLTSSLLFEEAFVSIEDETGTGDDATYIVESSQTSVGEGDFIYWFELTDNALVLKPTYRHNAIFEPQMPYAGAGIYYEGILLASNIASGAEVAEDDEVRTGVGEIRWSSLGEYSVELFAPDNRFVPASPGEGPFAFYRIGDRVIGDGPSRCYMIYKSGAYIAVKEMLEGYGGVSKDAGTIVANSLYKVTDKGAVAIDANGKLDPIRGLDYAIMKEWVSSLSSVRVVFDHRLGAIFIFNPTVRKAFVIWLTTSMITELEHMSFSDCGEGFVPGSETSAKRAFFVTDGGRVFVVDAARERTVQSMLETPLTAAQMNDTVQLVDINQITISTNTNNQDLKDMYVVPVTGAAVGTHFLVSSVSAGTLTVSPDPVAVGMTVGDQIAISPVLVRVGAPAVGLQDESGMTFGPTDLFRERIITGIGLNFQSVVVPDGGENNATFRGYVLNGLDDTPQGDNRPKTTGGVDFTSIYNGPSRNYSAVGGFGTKGILLFPVVEIACTGIDFNLLGMKILGSIQREVREGRAE